MAAEEELKSCDECGATIYPEHLAKNTAGLWKGRLLCPHCLVEKKELTQLPQTPGTRGAPPEPADAPIDLVPIGAEGEIERPAAPAIKMFGEGGISFGQGAASEDKFKRPLFPDSRNATRCRTFHCKLNDASLAYLNQQVNDWIDAHDDIHVKFATSNIGVVEGKHADPHLILTLFY